MLTDIHPKLPMRDKDKTRSFYINELGFHDIGSADYDGYLMMQKEKIQIHFFVFKELDPKENYGQIYIRVEGINQFYQSLLDQKTGIHPNGHLETKPWGQKEFSLLEFADFWRKPIEEIRKAINNYNETRINSNITSACRQKK